jgi:hypothetical protein
MPYSCITIQFMKIKSRLSKCIIEKDLKVNIMLQFEPHVLLNFKAPVA